MINYLVLLICIYIGLVNFAFAWTHDDWTDTERLKNFGYVITLQWSRATK